MDLGPLKLGNCDPRSNPFFETMVAGFFFVRSFPFSLFPFGFLSLVFLILVRLICFPFFSFFPLRSFSFPVK